MKPFTCSFYGLGLIGGSIARALREARPDARILACDIQESALLQAKEEGIADEIFLQLDAASAPSFCAGDYIFLCAPVSHNNENLRFLKQYLHPDSILTDVGSVKAPIHELAEKEGLSGCFIGGHPMAGSERVGFANSRASLLENAYYILTPSDQVPRERIREFSELVRSLGAIPLVLDYRQHDYITAAVSHLPHVIASSLVNLVRDSDSADGLMKMIAAGGFKDITRIASSSTVMWQQICLTNSVNISDLLGQYIKNLQKVKAEIDGGDEEELYTFFDGARRYRDSFIAPLCAGQADPVRQGEAGPPVHHLLHHRPLLCGAGAPGRGGGYGVPGDPCHNGQLHHCLPLRPQHPGHPVRDRMRPQNQ